MQVEVCGSAAAAAARAAGLIVDALRLAIAERGVGTVALSGGHTPAPMFRELAGASLDWGRVHVFQVDERLVGETDERSNMRQIRSALGSCLAAHQLHAMPVEDIGPAAATAAYARALGAIAGTPLVLDVVHLGLGEDGHTASLFPGDAALDANGDIAHAAPHGGVARMTLTLPALNRARRRIWLAVGEAKRDVVSRLLAGDSALVASRVRTEDSILVVDTLAAGAPR
jgi:6-phosphogluconolactonase